MNLVERAKRFVAPSPSESQIELIKDCIKANNLESIIALKLLFQDMYGGATYNMDEKLPPACALICFGNDGIKALVEAVH